VTLLEPKEDSNGEPGIGDKFSLSLSNGCSASSGDHLAGNIQTAPEVPPADLCSVRVRWGRRRRRRVARGS
jgi:hypothetical protein